MNEKLQLITIINMVLFFSLMMLSLVDVKKISYIYISILFALLCIFPVLRTVHYGDTENYYEYYTNVFENDRFEYLFSRLTEFSLSIGLGFTEYIFFVSLLTTSIYIYSLLKISKILNAEIKAAIFAIASSLAFFPYYYMTFETVRDGISTAIVLVSLVFLIKSQYVKYLIFIVVAILFHKGAFIFLFIPFLMKLNINNTRVLIAFTSVFLLSFIIKDFLLSLPFFGEKINSLLVFYSRDLSSSKTVIVRYIIILLFSLFLLGRSEYDSRSYRVIKFIILIVIAASMFASFPDMHRRILLKIEFITYPLLMMLFLEINRNKRKYFLTSLFVIFYYIFFLSNYSAYYQLLNIPPLIDLVI